jgi:trehalose 6-phosphate synthase/phosphatase
LEAGEIDGVSKQDKGEAAEGAWTLEPRYGHAAMISGIRSLAATHEQLIIGWTGAINVSSPALSPSTPTSDPLAAPTESPTDKGRTVPSSTVSPALRASLRTALQSYQPKESDPDDDRKTEYVPVWLEDSVAHGHYEGYCKTSEWRFLSAFTYFLLARLPLIIPTY